MGVLRGVLLGLVGLVAGCSGGEAIVRVTVNPASTQPSALRITLYGNGRLVFPSTLALGQKLLPGAVLVQNIDASIKNFRILVDGLDGNGDIKSQGATKVTLRAGAETPTTVQLVDGQLADRDGDGVPDVIDDCPDQSDADQRCAQPPDLSAPPPPDLRAGNDLDGAASSDLLGAPLDLRAAADLRSDQGPAMMPDLNGFVSCPGGSLFCDNFETGDTSKWDALVPGGSGATLAVSTNLAHSGTHALRAQTSGGTSTVWLKHRLRCQGDMSAECPITTGSLYFRAFLYSATAFNYPLYFLFAHRDSGDNDYVVGLDTFSGGGWYIYNKNPGSAYAMTGAFNPGVWHCVELEVEFFGSDNVVKIWVDGGTATSSPNITGANAAPAIGEIDVGVVYQNVGGGLMNDFYLDDIVASTSKIGCN